jgi:hypothetical protein
MHNAIVRSILLIFTVSIVGLTGCLFDNGSEPIVGDYRTGWVDTPEARCVVIDNGTTVLIPEHIFSVGYNSRYIVAKQHPYPHGAHLDTTHTYYYVIDRKQYPHQNRNGIYGPYAQTQLDSFRKVLAVGDIKFSLNYPNHY